MWTVDCDSFYISLSQENEHTNHKQIYKYINKQTNKLRIVS